MRRYLLEFWSDRRPQFLAFMWLVYLIAAAYTGWQKWSLGFAAGGFLLFFLAEYFLHRFLLHGLGKYILPVAYKGHEGHHDDPNSMTYLLTPNIYNIPTHLILWVVFTLIFGSLHFSSIWMMGLGTYQLYYEWAHYVSHRPIVPQTAWGKHVKKHHLLHHFKSQEGWYGVTNDAFDRVLGTSDSESKTIVRAKTNIPNTDDKPSFEA
jgi:4-hydroxysphinganine ceramide fatty acyl 2-hydroxylase